MIKYLFGLIAVLLSSTARSFELIKIDRALEKGGLHRHLANFITFKVESQREVDTCKLVFVENVNNEGYIYLEEVIKLSDFELHPKDPIDIEKPS